MGKLLCILLWFLILEGCTSESDAAQRAVAARTEGYNSGIAQGRNEGYTQGYEKGRSEVQAPVVLAQQEGRDAGYREGWKAGDAQGYERGYNEGQQQGFLDAHPGRTPRADLAVDRSFQIVSVSGGVSLIVAMCVFCAVLVLRSGRLEIIAAKFLAIIIGTASTYILYMTMGFGEAMSDVLLAPAPPNQVVYLCIIIVAILTYVLFAAARWLLRVVETDKMEALCIVGVSAAGMAIIILLTRILSVTPSIADYFVSSMLAGVFLGTLFYIMFWMIDRALQSTRLERNTLEAEKI